MILSHVWFLPNSLTVGTTFVLGVAQRKVRGHLQASGIWAHTLPWMPPRPRWAGAGGRRASRRTYLCTALNWAVFTRLVDPQVCAWGVVKGGRGVDTLFHRNVGWIVLRSIEEALCKRYSCTRVPESCCNNWNIIQMCVEYYTICWLLHRSKLNKQLF